MTSKLFRNEIKHLVASTVGSDTDGVAVFFVLYLRSIRKLVFRLFPLADQPSGLAIFYGRSVFGTTPHWGLQVEIAQKHRS